MIIAIASGKGGTGKTAIATSLALAAKQPLRFLDCDVEAPNAALFLKPKLEHRKPVGIPLPVIDEELCSYCGRCAEVCEFHAIAIMGNKSLIFPELCHGCGSCILICPEHAIRERIDTIGVLEGGSALPEIQFAQGILNIGEPMAVPVIRELKKWSFPSPTGQINPIEQTWPASSNGLEIRDAPPGASCPVVETLRGADFAILVTEPTPFGYHDLRQVVEICRDLNIPAGVIINRDGIGEKTVEEFCASEGLPILMRIPLQRNLAQALAQGETIYTADVRFRAPFEQLLTKIREIADV
ncbi:MAG: ATP-binding protein [Anaerolineales bacterium]